MKNLITIREITSIDVQNGKIDVSFSDEELNEYKVCFTEMPHPDFYKAWKRVQDMLIVRLNIRQREEDDKLISQTIKRAYKKQGFFITARFSISPRVANSAEMEFAAKSVPEDVGLNGAIGNLFSETESYINGFKQAQTELFPEPKNGDAATLKVM